MGPIVGFRGEQIRPGDGAYDEARAVFNAMVDKRPALIAQATCSDDVVLAVAFARRERLAVTVRAGGHSVAGMSMNDGGVVIDVRPIDHVEIDPRARVARVGAGVTWGRFDRAAAAHGLATTGGRVSTTGVAGFTIGGGSGWLERRCGLACDNLVGLTMVTSDGDVVRASETKNPELLWAHRGGGGNFGVLTELEFRLHELPTLVYGGLALYDPAHGRKLVRAYRDFQQSAPDEVELAIVYLTCPPEPFIPPEWHGRLAVGVAGMYAGAAEVGEHAIRPFVERAERIVDLFGPLPYPEFQCMIDDPPGKRNWWTADYLADLPDEAVEAFCAYSEEMPNSFSQMLLVGWGGAVARNAGSGPLANRDAKWVIHPFAVWEEPGRDDEHISWGRRSHDVFSPWATGVTYLNFIGNEGPERIRSAFGDEFERLVAVKRTWDPENVFRGNQNIRPRNLATA